MSYEYKCVGAPERPKRQRGVRGRSDRVALAMQEIIAAEAVDGWEYQRTDLVPVEERMGLFSRLHEVHRAVMVFRRALEPAPRPVPARRGAAGGAPAAAMAADPQQALRAGAATGQSARDQPARDQSARDPSTRNEPGGGDQRIPLSADRADPPPARQAEEEPGAPGGVTRRPPTGLG